MAPALRQIAGLGRTPFPSSPPPKPASSSSSSSIAQRHHLPPVSSRPRAAVVLKANAQTRERQRLKEQFEAASKRCRTAPMEGVSFTVEDFLDALDKYELDAGVGAKVCLRVSVGRGSGATASGSCASPCRLRRSAVDTCSSVVLLCQAKVKGKVFSTDLNGALVDITVKSSACLPVQEACIYRVKHVAEAGIFPGFQDEFVIVGENEADGSLVLSLRSIQYGLAWERCRQLQAEDAIVKGKITARNKGGVVVHVEGLRGFVPFSQILMKLSTEELVGKELPLKFVEVDEEQSRLVLSNCKAMTDRQAQPGIGSIVTGIVQSLKPYGVLVDIGGLTGLLHISQISHYHVSDISAVLRPGDILKVMILSHDCENGRVSLSTKKLEPTPGDIIHNPKLVFEKADEMGQIFRQRISQAEEMARADMLGFQSENCLRTP